METNGLVIIMSSVSSLCPIHRYLLSFNSMANLHDKKIEKVHSVLRAAPVETERLGHSKHS